VEQLEKAMIGRALGYGGTVSGEHGVGIGKIEHIIEEHGG
jgi:D-lactate dehydrogenase (cytochrome)